ncbi:hypothetical protein GIB67_002688 [Kingdonia uniflora]|uniref:MULE transposase domain-containing protein n=1 Tax=Kingdonia uniflora TaxID=39325 RepID=A0A7J7LJX4_9MAGN|nr:hypothetical protein GIB67_002688 [Kingdonia uniflora]
MERIVGLYDEGYFKMPSFTIELLTANPRNIIGYSRDDASLQWTGNMVMFKASYDGWLRGCRPVLGLDGCFLKGKYRGVCLSIIGFDGNNGLFPVATYFCRSECYDTWNTFLQALQPLLDQHDAKLIFISDRQKGLIKAVADNFHHCNHRFCFRHMYKNFKKIYIGTHLEKLPWNAARAYRTIDKDNFLAKLGEDHLYARHWLEREPPETWYRSHFDSTAKCEHITNNFSESFNNWILRVRDKPLHKSLKKLNMMMMTLIYDRRTKASIWDQDGLVPRAVAHIAKLKKWYGKFNLVGVDKNKWTATKDGQSVIYPVANETSRVKPPKEFRTPPLLRPTGRPRKSRRKDKDELTNGSARRCGKCRHYGHNKKTCKSPPAADKGSEPRPSTATSETTQTCRRVRQNQQKTSNQFSERARQQNTSTRITHTQTNAKGT